LAEKPEGRHPFPRKGWWAVIPENGGDAPRLPNRIAGGFKGLGDDLERRTRDFGLMARLLEQQRLELETAERERRSLYGQLPQVVAAVQEAERAVTAAVEKSQDGDLTGDLTTLFAKSGRALDDLEKLALGLNANMLWWRSAWEQYARGVIKAHRLREEVRNDRS
jgi:hypothetical protein